MNINLFHNIHFKMSSVNAILYEVNPQNFSEIVKNNIHENANVLKNELTKSKMLSTIKLQSLSRLNDKSFDQAIGWLMHEGSIDFIENNNEFFICLNE